MLQSGSGQAVQPLHGSERLDLGQNTHGLLPQPLINQAAHQEPAELAAGFGVFNPAQAGLGILCQLQQTSFVAGKVGEQALQVVVCLGVIMHHHRLALKETNNIIALGKDTPDNESSNGQADCCQR